MRTVDLRSAAGETLSFLGLAAPERPYLFLAPVGVLFRNRGDAEGDAFVADDGVRTARHDFAYFVLRLAAEGAMRLAARRQRLFLGVREHPLDGAAQKHERGAAALRVAVGAMHEPGEDRGQDRVVETPLLDGVSPLDREGLEHLLGRKVAHAGPTYRAWRTHSRSSRLVLSLFTLKCPGLSVRVS